MKQVVMVAALALAGAAFGWDIGHDTVATSVLARMPEKWRSRVTGDVLRDFHEAAKLPDGGDLKLLGPDRAWFEARGVKAAYLLHNTKRYPLYLNRLVDAIRKDDVRRVAVLVAALSHSISDDGACNHDPLTHMLTYIWGPNGYGVMPGVKVDFGWVDLDEAAHAVLKRRVAELKVPAAREETYEQFLSRALLWSLEGGEVALKNSPSSRADAGVRARAGRGPLRHRLLGRRAHARVLRRRGALRDGVSGRRAGPRLRGVREDGRRRHAVHDARLAQ